MSFVGLVPSTEDIYIAAVRRLAAHCWHRLRSALVPRAADNKGYRRLGDAGQAGARAAVIVGIHEESGGTPVEGPNRERQQAATASEDWSRVMPRSESVDPLFRLIRFFVAQKRFRFLPCSRIPAGSTALPKIGFSKSCVRKNEKRAVQPPHSGCHPHFGRSPSSVANGLCCLSGSFQG
jgi:hypothetical protein